MISIPRYLLFAYQLPPNGGAYDCVAVYDRFDDAEAAIQDWKAGHDRIHLAIVTPGGLVITRWWKRGDEE